VSGRRVLLFALACAALPLAGCNAVQSSLAPVGDQARAIHGLWQLMLWICGGMYLLVLAGVAFALLRNRGRGHAVAGDRGIERGLLVFALVVAALLTVLTAASFAVDRRLHAPVSDPLNVRITAKQWWWQVEYLDPEPSLRFVTANELRLPVDRPARIELRATDVIHSLWVPVLAGKEDMIPGRANVIVMTPRRTGRYRGQCAEFCGLQHANMALDVEVLDAQAFNRWRAAQRRPAAPPASASARRGQQVFARTACALCHTVRGAGAGGVAGPDLTHLASRRTLAAGTLPLTRDELAAWIADPQRHKPGTNMPAVPLSNADLAAVTDYLMELH
jgi:cytochrome c oxidase subunit 2